MREMNWIHYNINQNEQKKRIKEINRELFLGLRFVFICGGSFKTQRYDFNAFNSITSDIETQMQMNVSFQM